MVNNYNTPHYGNKLLYRSFSWVQKEKSTYLNVISLHISQLKASENFYYHKNSGYKHFEVLVYTNNTFNLSKFLGIVEQNT